MSNRQVIYFLFLVLFAVFLLSVSWEFMLEDTIGAALGIDIAEEPAKQKWIYVFGGVFFAGVAVIGPLLLLQKNATARRRAEGLLSSAIANLQEGFALFDADDRLVMCNKQYQRLHPLGEKFIQPGVLFEDIIRANVARGNVVDAKGHDEEHIRNRMEQHRNPKGPIVRTLTSGVCQIISECRTPDGGVCLTMTEVTTFKQAEEKIRKLNLELEARVDRRTQDLFNADRANRLLRTVAVAANEAATVEDAVQVCLDEVCAFTGWPVGHAFRVTGPNRIDSMKIWHLDDPEKFEVFRKVTHGAHFVSGGLSGKALDTGKPYWVKDVGKDKGYQRGQLAADLGVKAGFAFPVLIGKEVVAVLEFYSMEAADPDQASLDIMAQVGTQLGRVVERERADCAVRDSEDRYARAISGTNDGLWDWNIETGENYFSPQFEQILGYDESELEPVLQTFLDLLHPDDRERTSKAIPAHLENRIPYDLEYRLRCKDGEYKWLRARGQAIWNEQGKATMMAGSISNISERKKAEQAVIRAKEEAELANRTKSEFLANISHELRTPLNAIIGFSDTIRERIFGPLANKKYEEYVENIYESGQHLLELINDILDVSAIEAGKIELDEKDLDLADVARVSVGLVRDRAEKGRVRIVNDIGYDIPPLHADERRIKQILLNLLSNAVKFTPEKGEVKLTARVGNDGCILLTISDTGVGMDQDDIARALMPFGRADSAIARTQEGTGLGLPVTRGLVEAHGGIFRLVSTPGSGTTVTIRFPPERVIAKAKGPALISKS